MFDPERDDAPARSYFARVAVMFVVGLSAGLVLLPSVTGFEAGPEQTQTCIAIVDGFKPELAPPNVDLTGTFPAPLSAAERNDPAAVARFRSAVAAAQQSPEWQRVVAYETWLAQSGNCVKEGRHRLIQSGAGLGILAMIGGGGLAMSRARRRRTFPPADPRPVDPMRRAPVVAPHPSSYLPPSPHLTEASVSSEEPGAPSRDVITSSR